MGSRPAAEGGGAQLPTDRLTIAGDGAVYLADSDSPGALGVARLTDTDTHAARLELHGPPAFWEHHYAHEAALAVMNRGFTSSPQLQRVFAEVDPRNRAMLDLLRRLGMRREGTLRAHLIVDGHPRDTVILSVLSHEWTLDRCPVCGRPLLSTSGRRPRTYCSDACKAKAFRARRASRAEEFFAQRLIEEIARRPK